MKKIVMGAALLVMAAVLSAVLPACSPTPVYAQGAQVTVGEINEIFGMDCTEEQLRELCLRTPALYAADGQTAYISSMEDWVVAVFGGYTSFALTADMTVESTILIRDRVWHIDGQGHTLTKVSNPTGNAAGSILCVSDNGVLYINDGASGSGGLYLNGNGIKTNMQLTGAGDTTISCIHNGRLYAGNVTVYGSHNFGYDAGVFDMDGGTGFNCIDSGYMELQGCTAYDCDGAAFYTGGQAGMKLRDCTAYDCSYGVVNHGTGAHEFRGLRVCASRYDAGKNIFGFYHGGVGFTNDNGMSYTIRDSYIAGAQCAVRHCQGDSLTLEGCTVSGFNAAGYRRANAALAGYTVRQLACHYAVYGMKDKLAFDGIPSVTVYDCFTAGRIYAKNTRVVYGDCGMSAGSGTAYADAGTVIEKCHTGMLASSQNSAEGTVCLRGAEIRKCDVAIHNGGSLKVTGGTICSNTTCGIRNEGTVDISGSYVSYDNPYGIMLLAGTLKQRAAITRNSRGKGDGHYTVYYGDGVYRMSGAASVTDGIYLCPGKYVEVAGKLTASGMAGTLVSGDDASDRPAGRVMGVVWDGKYGTAKTMVDGTDRKYAVGFAALTRPAGAAAALRPGNGKNGGAAGTFVLSSAYDIAYQVNLDGYELKNVAIAIDRGETFVRHYYMEGQEFAKVSVTTKDGRDISKALVFAGWNTKPDGSGSWFYPGRVYDAKELETTARYRSGLTLYAQWTLGSNEGLPAEGKGAQTFGDGFVMTYDRNIDVGKGEKPAAGCQKSYSVNIASAVGGTVVFDANRFGKERKASVYDEDRGAYEDYLYEYSFHGWSQDAAAAWADEGVCQPGETVDALLYLDRVLGLDSVIIEDGRVRIVQYAVWDEYPFITAHDRYLYDYEVEDGTLSEDWLLKEVRSDDREDGDVGVEIVDFDPEDFRGLGEDGWTAVTYRARDSVGNTVYRTVRVYVSPMLLCDGDTYVRFIDRENYDKDKHEDGAMEADSVWYVKEDYARVLTEAFRRTKNGDGIVTYRFSADDIKKAQEYRRAHGSGNTVEADALANWVRTFAHCRIK